MIPFMNASRCREFIEYDAMKAYRPEGLRKHERLADYYKDIPVPPEEKGVLGFIRSFFLTS